LLFVGMVTNAYRLFGNLLWAINYSLASAPKKKFI
jgi:hypothetical protein